MAMRNLITWNALIVGLIRNKLYCDAMEAFRSLLNDDGLLTPNQVNLSSVLSACSNVCTIRFGRAVHDLVVKLAMELSLAYVRNSLIDMYCKCGCLEEVAKVFDRCPDRDVVTWNVMMMGWIESD
ncbi:pentatricopeptide repeat-containing protein At1g50270-like [Zingiber officinale]|uniref:pentatricopeptide repeat-containing protein At1g50270-like n=1 Tax=Zingiber officinale TaxID=94328 RepID=UPI001C4CF684|nr:pentatricopeptide repeat-containing protein At1g50270-like [Zingiber officinale]